MGNVLSRLLSVFTEQLSCTNIAPESVPEPDPKTVPVPVANLDDGFKILFSREQQINTIPAFECHHVSPSDFYMDADYRRYPHLNPASATFLEQGILNDQKERQHHIYLKQLGTDYLKPNPKED